MVDVAALSSSDSLNIIALGRVFVLSGPVRLDTSTLWSG